MRVTLELLPNLWMTAWMKSRTEYQFICIRTLLFIWGLQLAWGYWGMAETWAPLCALQQSSLWNQGVKNDLDAFLSIGNWPSLKEMEPSQFNLINFSDRENGAVWKSSVVPYWKQILLYSGEGRSLIFSSITVLKFSVTQTGNVHVYLWAAKAD